MRGPWGVGVPMGRRWSSFGCLFGGLLLVSTSGPFFLASQMDPYAVGFTRMGLSGGLLFGYALFRYPPWSRAGRGRWRAARGLVPSLILGAGIFALHLLFWMSAFAYTSLGSSALLLVAQPAMAVVVGGYYGERFRPAMGVSLALAGVALFLVAAGDLELGPRAWIGDGLCLLAALCTTLFIPTTRVARRELPMPLFLGVTFLLGALFTAPLLPFSSTPLTAYGWDQWRWLLGIVLVSTVGGHGLTNLAARRFTLFRLNVVILLQPLLVIAIGAILFELRATLPQILAALLLLVAVAVGLWGTRDAELVPT